MESVLLNQLLRSGTSIGANIHEAQYAQSKPDFIHKLEVSLKECNESEYWIRVLFDVDSLQREELEKFEKECIDIRRMLVSSVTTLKNR